MWIIRSLVLSLLLAVCICGWSGERYLFNKTKRIVTEAMFTHTASPHLHNVLVSVWDPTILENELAHYLYDENFNLVASRRFGFISSSASVTGDGANFVFAAYSADSKRNEILFYESKDGGLNWSGPNEISRRDGNTRRLPQVLYKKETGRVYVFYLVGAANASSIVFVSRPKDSRVFSEERIVYSTNLGLYKPGVALTGESNKSTIHLLWAGMSRASGAIWTYYAQSTNQGISWTAPVILERNILYPFLTLKESGSAKHSVLAATSLNGSTCNMRYSFNAGKTWAAPVPFRVGMGRDTAVCTDESDGTTAVFTITNNVYTVLYDYAAAGSATVKKGDKPFYDSDNSRFDSDPHITCYKQADSPHFTVFVAGAKFLNGRYQMVVNSRKVTKSEFLSSQDEIKEF